MAVAPIWDDSDDVWRCSKCLHELVDGQCSSDKCSVQYLLPEGVSVLFSFRLARVEADAHHTSLAGEGLGEGKALVVNRD